MRLFLAAALAVQAAPLMAQHHGAGTTLPVPPTLDTALKQATFDLVWRTLHERYYDRGFKGLDWQRIGEEYRPRALAAADHPAFHSVLNEMVKRLGDSHLSVIGPPSPDAPFGSALTAVGIELVAGGTSILVNAVEAGGPAARAGIVAADEILAVDGIPVARIGADYVASLPVEQRQLGADQLWLAVHQRLRGSPEAPVEIRVRTTGGIRDIRLERAASAVHGRIARPAFRLLDPSTGLLQLTTFHADLDALLDQAFAQCRTCDMLVIDVRGNNGGFADNIVKLLDRLMPAAGIAGLTVTARGPEPLRFAGSATAFRGRIAVLIDGRSASAAEVFAAAIQDLGRGRVFGSRSGGAVILSDLQPLPTGGSQLFPFALFHRASNARLEGVGVVPDHVVASSGEDLRDGRDPVLAAALAGG